MQGETVKYTVSPFQLFSEIIATHFEQQLKHIICVDRMYSCRYPFVICKGKGKVVPNRSGVTQRIPGGLDSQIFMTFGT